MKKKICFVLIVIMICAVIAPVNGVAADKSLYDELWTEKIEYESNPRNVHVSVENMITVYYGVPYDFILFTEIGKTFSYVKAKEDGGMFPLYAFPDNYAYYLYCEKLAEIYAQFCDFDSDYPHTASISMFRKVIQTLGISKEEYLMAYDAMKNNPDSIRTLLSFLSDEEFSNYKKHLETIRLPENFIVEAAFLDDEVTAESLLCYTGSVYIQEEGYSIALYDLFVDNEMPIDKFAQYDLTTPSMRRFLDNLRYLLTVQSPGCFDGYEVLDGRTSLEKLEYLEAARDAQLKAAQTGDGAVTALWVVALAVPALAVLVTLKRKRRI